MNIINNTVLYDSVLPEGDYLFHKNLPFVSSPRFMLWKNVLNPHHGYIKDDAVTFQVCTLFAFVLV